MTMSVAVLSLMIIISVSRSLHGGREAVVEEDEDAAGQVLFSGGEFPAVVEREAAFFDLSEGFDEDGDL